MIKIFKEDITDIVQDAYDSIITHPDKICLYLEKYASGHEKKIINQFKKKLTERIFKTIDYPSSKKYKDMTDFQLYNSLLNEWNKNKKLFFIILDPFSQLDGKDKSSKLIGEFKISDITYNIDVGAFFDY